MATYKGEISGIGNSKTRENEITADKVAIFRNAVIGYNTDIKNAGGVIYSPNHDFYCHVDGFVDGGENTKEYSNTVHVTDGMVFAYGYFAYCEATDFTFLPPAVEQYHIIYLEIDRSVIPNTAILKTKNNQSSSRILSNTFRRDQLSTVKTGVNQIPLWLIKVTNKGIKVEDLRDTSQTKKGYDLRNPIYKIEKTLYSDFADAVVDNGEIGENVTCPTPSLDIDKNAEIIANCEFVQKLIKQEVNR